MNIRYRDRDPEIPSGGSNPITDATARRRRAGSHNGPHGLPRCTWFIAVGLRYPYGETGRNGGIGGGPIPDDTTRCGARKCCARLLLGRVI